MYLRYLQTMGGKAAYKGCEKEIDWLVSDFVNFPVTH